jgi:hypothetical protein
VAATKKSLSPEQNALLGTLHVDLEQRHSRFRLILPFLVNGTDRNPDFPSVRDAAVASETFINCIGRIAYAEC